MGRIRAGLKFNVGKHGRVYVPVTGGGSGGKKGNGSGCSWRLIKWPLLVLLAIAIFVPKNKSREPEATPAPTEVVRAMAEQSQETDPVQEVEPSPDQELTAVEEPTEEPAATKEPEIRTYILNTGSKKFHYPSCSSVKDIKENNKQEVECTRDELLDQGYEPCGRCHP